MSIVLPNFLIPGANKAGTSYLAEVLSQHPDIFIPYSKEPSFFSTDQRFGQYGRGMRFYQKNFVEYSGEAMVGEASTVYMFDPESPRLISRHIPGCRLIFSLRDPVSRVYSNYWQARKGGLALPQFSEFIRSDEFLPNRMILVSRYDIHLGNYFQHFSRERILIFLYEEMAENPEAVFGAIMSFLGVDPLPADVNLYARINPSSTPRSRRLARILKNRSITQGIKNIVPARLAPIGKALLEQFRRVNQQRFDYPALTDADAIYLREKLYMVPEFVTTELGLDISAWN